MAATWRDVLEGRATWSIDVADCREWLRQLPDGCVQCAVSSPPYYGLRDYGTGTWEGGGAGCDHAAPPSGVRLKGEGLVGSGNRDGYSSDGQFRDLCGKCGAIRIDRQIGLEKSPEEFIGGLVEVFKEVKRLLRDDGILFVNMGDSYCNAGSRNNGTGLDGKRRGGVSDTDGSWKDAKGTYRDMRHALGESGIKHKDMLGIPWRLAFGLQDDGWYLRSDMPWVKRSSMPESVTDRPAKALEYVFMMTKKPAYFFDMDSVRQQQSEGTIARFGTDGKRTGAGPKQAADPNGMVRDKASMDVMILEAGRNFRNADLWFQSINTPHGLVGLDDELVGLDVTSEPYSEAHFATFPPRLIVPLIKAGTSEHGCCPACGAPFRRVTERTKLKRSRPNDLTKRTGEAGTDNHCGNTVAGTSVATLGWEATCKCRDAGDPIPCLVLDPFCGAGTTPLVARRLQRRAIGCELNPAYAEMSRKRVAEDSPLFNVDHGGSDE